MAEKEDTHEKGRHARSPSPEVKSTAVVKYTSVLCPVEFARLQCNTDLNMPPSNWLSSATDSYGLRHALSQSVGFSSFRMAHMFPDCVGEVDVVSGAECIKTLLKLPYHPNGMISMMVHRVENTLLLDDFDIYRYLMKSEWSWMKKFFYENVVKSLRSKDKVMYIKNKSRFALQQKSLVSKFLYHSLVPSSQAREYKETSDAGVPTLPITGPNLPEPNVQENIPDPGFSNHTYNRNVVWTFEDIQMLIGSDMPIFGGVDRPCVSLRLRDASEPINVLTGIDYWLDNLMCNVPEVVMCYHLDGIVQKYEPIKTEDLPNLEDSKFSPKVIRNVAQNILSFLKSNATKAGHTYWLFKGTHDDVVKLYDLTTLCGTVSNPTDPDENPFTIPVAMLLYRVARNMSLPCQAGHIRLLLENCIKLLPIEKYPQIVASSHYMLANLYVPAETNPGDPSFRESSTGECECGDPITCRRRDEDDEESFSDKSNRDDGASSLDTSKISLDGATSSSSPGRKGKQDKSDKESGSSCKSGKVKGSEGHFSRGVAVDSLMHPRVALPPPEGGPESPPPGVDGHVGERCLLALGHVREGLEALRLFPENKEFEEGAAHSSKPKFKEDENPKMARPFEPIPMSYEPLNPKEDENPKMARPFEPIPMTYEPLNSKEETQMTSSDEPIALGYSTEENTQQTEDINTNKSEQKPNRRRKKKRQSIDHSDTQKNVATKQDIDNLIKKPDGVLLRKDNSLPTWQEPNDDDDSSWNIHLKILLYEKTCLSYATLAEQHYKDGQYGLSFKYIVLAQKCQDICKILSNSHAVEDSCLLGRAGDNLFQFSKNWEKYGSCFVKQIGALSDVETRIMEAVDNDLVEYSKSDNYKPKKRSSVSNIVPPKDLEHAMISSCEFYSQALKLAPENQKEELLRRIASVKNELGVKYMYNAQENYAAFCSDENPHVESKDSPLFETYAKKSLACLMDSARIFEQVNDLPNLALLHCNTGRFMRFKAHCNQINHSPEQRRLYSMAVEHYGQALRLLLGRGCEPVRDLVRWELSTALFTQACLLQDSPPNSADAAEEAVEALRVALRNCPLTPGPRQCLYQFRAAVLHHRLASLYHNQYRDPKQDMAKRKAMSALSKLNYEQAVKLFILLDDSSMLLTVQLEHVALLEYQANNSAGIKLKCLQAALELLQQSEPFIHIIATKEANCENSDSSLRSDETNNTSVSDESPEKKSIENKENGERKKSIEKDEKSNKTKVVLPKEDEDLKAEFKLLFLFQQRLQFILKSLIQLCLQKHSGVSKKDSDKMSSAYKNMYSLTLRIGKFKCADCKMFAKKLCEILIKMKDYAIDKNEL